MALRFRLLPCELLLFKSSLHLIPVYFYLLTTQNLVYRKWLHSNVPGAGNAAPVSGILSKLSVSSIIGIITAGYGIKNEVFLAHVEGDYTVYYSPHSNEGKPVKGCPFLKKNLSGDGFTCAIYATRPQVCKEFRCYRMLIYDREGNECGRIMGTHDLKTTDKILEKIWKEEVAPIPGPGTAARKNE